MQNVELFPTTPSSTDQTQEIDAKIAELAAEASEVTESVKPTKDYVTYMLTEEELRIVSEFEAVEFKSLKRETMYTTIHRLIGEKCRNFQLGGIVASNGALDPNEPIAVVYRRPLNSNERLTDFPEDQIVDGKVQEVAHLPLGGNLASRLFIAATVFGPIYNALKTQYSLRHIYNMAGRLAQGVVVGDPSTYLTIDQNIGNGLRSEDEVFTVYRMIYTGLSQTAETVTRIPAIVAYNVYETNVSSNIAEIFPVVRCGNRIGFNTYLSFDCVFEEPSIRLDQAEDEVTVEDINISDALCYINNQHSIQHLNRKTGDLI